MRSASSRKGVAKLVALFGVAFVLLGFASGCSGASSTASSQPSSTTSSQAKSEFIPLEVPGRAPEEQPQLEELFAMSDLVVHGRVLAQARAWWNGTDGLRWTADRPGAQPMLYSTWIIQVWGVFKGATPAGALLAVRTEGGELPTDSGGVVMLPKHGWPQMAADDQVVVFLVQDDNRYQGVYEPPGFWLATGAGSVMKRAEDGRFVRQGVTASAAGAMAPEELFALFEKLASQAEVPGHQGQERWSSGALTLDRVRELLTQKLPAGAALILPGTLPAGWAVADPGQGFPEFLAAGSQDNPSISSTGEYRVVFTDGRRLAAVRANVVGDWGDTPFVVVWASSRAVLVSASSESVAAIRPDLPGSALVADRSAWNVAITLAGLLEKE